MGEVKKTTKKQSVKRELTETEKAFCFSFVESWNLELAAKAAGYSGEDVKAIAYELVRDPAVWSEIESLKEVRRKCFLNSEGDVVERQMRIAFADITDYVEFGACEAEVYDPKSKEMQVKTVNRVVFKDSPDVDGGVVSEVGVSSDGSAKIKLADRDKALEWLTKYFNMFPLDRLKAEFERQKTALNLDNKNVEIRFLREGS
ncbi:MAG: terminase small subunit [Defluviitaleaceae bacterium]|nr:terminase small subunit [Defluviitaleaceae bacterium]